MKLVQVFDPKKGIQAAKLENDKVFTVAYEQKGVRSLLDLVQYAAAVKLDLPEVVDELASKEPLAQAGKSLNAAPDPSRSHLAIPIHPPEVWACGVTYKKSAEFRDEDTQTSKGIYDHVYSASALSSSLREEQDIALEPMISLACAVTRSLLLLNPNWRC